MARAAPLNSPRSFGSSASRRPIQGELELDPPRGRTAGLDPAVENLSRWMDSAFEIPGLKWRFGLDAIIGLIPGLGDTLTSFISAYVLTSAVRAGVPKVTIARMGLNLCIDYILGAVPVLGDAFDVWFKANNRNVALMKRALDSPQQSRRARTGDWLFVTGVIAVVFGVLIAAVIGAIYLTSLLFSAIFN